MNQTKDSHQSSFMDIDEQTTTSCPLKPKIPYSLQQSNILESVKATYLQPENRKHKSSLSIGTSFFQQKEHQCCDKFEQIIQANEKSLQTQLETIYQLNILIKDHSQLLEHVIQQRRNGELQNLSQSDNSKELSDNLKLLQSWKQKFEQEQRKNEEKENKLIKLRKRLEELNDQYETNSETIILNDQVNTWKNKFLNLNVTQQETLTKLEVLEKELENLKSIQQSLRDSGQDQTITTKTITRKRQSVVKFDIKT